MTYIKYTGPWVDVAIDRHIVSTHLFDSDDLTVALILPDSQSPALRAGEVEITQAEYETTSATSNAWNAKIVAKEPPAKPDPDAELAAAIAAATDIAGLKAALLGNKGAGKVKGRPV